MKIKENPKKINKEEDVKFKRLLNNKKVEKKLGYFLENDIYLGVK